MITDGLLSSAQHVPAHPARVGSKIAASAIVLHTSDCAPGTMHAIVRNWNLTPGQGNAAHLFVGRTPADGVVQMVPFDRNANHAGGGTSHGWFTEPHVIIHPNGVAIGIETDCAGYLGHPVVTRDGIRRWYHPDSKVEIPAVDVYIDSRGIGWHKLTQYQYDQLALIIDEIRPTLKPCPSGWTVSPNGSYAANGSPWAATKQAVIVGHVTLDPTQKTDPGPVAMDWIRARYGE